MSDQGETMIWPVMETHSNCECPDCGHTAILMNIRPISGDLCPVCMDKFLRANIPTMKPVKKDG